MLVQPMTYIFDEEPARWHALLAELDLDEATAEHRGLLGGSGNGHLTNGASH